MEVDHLRGSHRRRTCRSCLLRSPHADDDGINIRHGRDKREYQDIFIICVSSYRSGVHVCVWTGQQLNSWHIHLATGTIYIYIKRHV